MPQIARRGFSLIELLLTIVLLMLLLGAVVFNFSTLQSGQDLEEGATRFATMLRYARSHAAFTGRAVRLQLQPAETAAADNPEELLSPLRSFVLQWEPDPLGEPGRYQSLRLTSWDIDTLNELVAVESLEVPRPLMGRTMPAYGVESGVVAQEATEGTALAEEPVLTFYPDGSSDTARIVLVSRDERDSRKVALRVEGITGTIESGLVNPETEFPSESESEFEPETEAPLPAENLATVASP